MALNVGGKKTSLDESASIYTKRCEDESEKAKWSRMSRQEKWIHFKTYYLRIVLLGMAVLALVGFFLYKEVNKKDLAYRSAIVNEGMMEVPLADFSENFIRYMGMNPKKSMASFQLYFTTAEMANKVGASAANDLTQLSAMIYANDLDSMIAGEEDFSMYLNNSFFVDISTVLSEDELSTIREYLYIPDKENNPDEKAYGVYLNQSDTYQDVFRDGGGIVEKPILGIMVNSERKEESRQLLYYLFPQLKK